MEGHRKNDRQKLAEGLGEALFVIDTIAETYHYDIEDVTDQTRDYHAQRAAHKPEARAAPGGTKPAAARQPPFSPTTPTRGRPATTPYPPPHPPPTPLPPPPAHPPPPPTHSPPTTTPPT